MKTRSQIVGELLKDGKITSDESVVLLYERVRYVYIDNPCNSHDYLKPPYVVTCERGTTNTSGSFTIR